MRLPLIVTTAVLTVICTAPIAAASPHVQPASVTPAYGSMWTADTAANSLTEWAPDASGAATPVAVISGVSTGLSGPSSVAVGPEGNIYAANSLGNSITEYAPGTNGDHPPIATIAGPATGLNGPDSLTLAVGEVWVTDPAANLVEGFSAGTTGNELPAQTISGPKTRLNHPISLAVDNEIGLVTVLNAPTSGAASITTYFRFGNVAPVSRVLGSRGHALVSPTAIFSSGFGLVWVADGVTDSLTELFVIENGIPAIRTIKGPSTHLNGPAGIALDARAQIVVANTGDHTIRVFATGARGDAAPVRTIDTGSSSAGSPAAISVVGARPGAPMHVTAVAHNASATVHWQAPAVTGGGIIGYDVSAVSRTRFTEIGSGGGGLVTFGGNGASTTKTSMTLHHLKNGRKYFFLVQAVNEFGFSSSGRSNKVTPLTVPAAPANVIAAGGDKAIAVGWAKPKQDGGDPIKRYRVEYATCSPGALDCAFASRLVSHIHRHVQIGGLHGATTYHVRVIAESAFGNGHPSKLTSATTT